MTQAANDNAELNSLEDARRVGTFLKDQFGRGAQAEAHQLLKALALLGPMRADFSRELYATIIRLETSSD